MHGRAPVREEPGRLDQRQPGAQAGGDVVRSRRDQGLQPDDGVLGAGQRDQQRIAAIRTAGGATPRRPGTRSGRSPSIALRRGMNYAAFMMAPSGTRPVVT